MKTVLRQALWGPQEIARLLSPPTYREILAEALLIRREKGKPMTYAALARNAGFAARSFPRDVVLGAKSLTERSAESISLALKFPADLRDYFCARVAYETLTTGEEKQVERVRRAVDVARARLMRKAASAPTVEDTAFSIENFSVVYACLGDVEQGSDREEIRSRSGLDAREIEQTLSQLIGRGLVRVEGDRYYASMSHLALSSLKAEGAFHKLYLKRLAQAKRVAEAKFKSDEMLFLESTFSVRKEKLAELKEELRQVLTKFVDNSEAPEGDDVVTLTSAFYSLKGLRQE